MTYELNYSDLTPQELADEIAGLDEEIASCQATLAKMKKSLKQKQNLRESLIDICSRRMQIRGWPTRA